MALFIILEDYFINLRSCRYEKREASIIKCSSKPKAMVRNFTDQYYANQNALNLHGLESHIWGLSQSGPVDKTFFQGLITHIFL